jgi:hypothetical protein
LSVSLWHSSYPASNPGMSSSNQLHKQMGERVPEPLRNAYASSFSYPSVEAASLASSSCLAGGAEAPVAVARQPWVAGS